MTQTDALVLSRSQEPVSMELFNIVRDQATMLLKTGFLPPHLKTPEQVVAVVLIGRELQVPMMQAVRKIFVIQGTPALASELMLALAERTGQIEDIRIEDDGACCTVTIKRKGRKSPVTTSFSMKDAEAMGLAGKDNWKKQPAVMRRWRTIAANLRLTFPDAIGGMYSVEEVAPELAVDVTGTPLAPPVTQVAEVANPLLPRRVGEEPQVIEAAPEPQPTAPPEATWDEIMEAMTGEAPPRTTPAGLAGAAPVTPAVPVAAESTPGVTGGTRFEMNGKQVVTAGITKDTLLKAYKMGAMVDELEGKGKAKDLLGREFGVEHRVELTEPMGQKYVAALVKIVNRHGKK